MFDKELLKNQQNKLSSKKYNNKLKKKSISYY